MNVLINAITITEGGGIVVLGRLLEFMNQRDPKITWFVTAEKNILTHLPSSQQIIGIPYSWARKSPLHLLYWYEIELPRIIKKVKASLCFSHTNFIPRRRLSCPSFLLIHNAGFFSDPFTRLQLQYYNTAKDAFLWKQKIKWVNYSIQHATAITVQTNVLADKINNRLKIPKEKIFVIPHGLGLLNHVNTIIRSFPTETCWRIGYITKFGVQKDFETVFRAVSRLKKTGIPIKLILTLNPQIKEYPPIFEKIRAYEIEDVLENLGDITNADTIRKVYESLHLFLFPSIIESFGFTLVEAMGCGLPVLVSNSDSNREVASHAGLFFPLGDDEKLTDLITYLMNNKHAYCLASKNSLERASDFCWKKTALQLMNVINKLTIHPIKE